MNLLPWTSPSLREQLRGPPVQVENFEGKKFFCKAAVEQLLTRERISRWTRTHPLHRESETTARDQELVAYILDGHRLLFAGLVAAGLEKLTFSFLAKGQSNDSPLEVDLESLRLKSDEQQRLEESFRKISVTLSKGTHQHLSQRAVLPYKTRESIHKTGAFGQIFRVEVAKGHLEGYDKCIVAEKEVRLNDPNDEQTYLREVDTLREREHPNIVPLLASYTLKTIESECDVKSLHFIFPLAKEDMAEWLMRRRPPAWLQALYVPDRRACLYRLIYALVSGLSFLHREKNGSITAHHDLKPQNVLVFEQELKIADFGRSHLRFLDQGSETEAGSHLGTYEYQPPEYWEPDGTHAKVRHGRAFDMWSLGCIIIEIITLIAYDWDPRKMAEFRDRRRNNRHKGKPKLAEKHSPDCSFHNNWTIVEEWVQELQTHDGSQKFNSTLNVALQMMNQDRDSRLYAWEAEWDLYNIQRPDDNRVTRLEMGGLCVQAPPLQGKILNGTERPPHRAARQGDLDRLCKLREIGWPLSVQDREGLTALDIFNRTQQPSAREQLSARLAPRRPESAATREQGEELLQAAGAGNVMIVRHLLAQGVDALYVNQASGASALFKAAENDRHEVIECLLQAGGKELLRHKNHQWHDTPLHCAVSRCHPKTIERLLAFAPDIEDQQIQGKTALYLAVERSHEESVDILLSHGAQVFSQTYDKDTPLHLAARFNKPRILKRLLHASDASRCREYKNPHGATPLWIAVFQRHMECANILLDHKASLHVSNVARVNILQMAIDRNWYDFVKQYIDEFVADDFEHRNVWDETPLMKAQKDGKQRFVDLLILKA